MRKDLTLVMSELMMLPCSLGMHVSTNVQLYRGDLVYLKPPS